MKKINLNKIAVLLVSLVVLTGCVEDDNFDVPSTIEGISEYPNTDAEFNTLSGVLGAFGSNGNEAYTYEAASETVSEKYTVGYVVSSDEGGNFYKQLVIQDAPENPTAAIVVQVDKNPLFTQYEFGRKVYVKLNGLTVGESNGVLQLGRLNGDQIDEIASTLVPNHIIRTSEVATIVPKEVSISQFSDALESQYIRLNNMQFNSNLVVGNTTTFASETNDSFDGERLLESCATGSSVILSTSTFSDFKGLPLPANRGSIDGVLTRDYFDDFYTIYINTPEAINFDNDLRCDPLFEDDFSAGNLDKWTPYNVTGTQEWYYNTFGNPDDSATMSGFSGGAQTNEDWLISLPIDLSNTPSAFLTFQTVKRYNGNDIEVFYATDYNGGDPTTDGTWVALSPTLDTNTGSWSSWTDSGSLDLSAAAGGNVFIAFKYTSTSSAAATWEIDNVKVSAE
ncbi:hypothetical protein FHS04_001850 [Mesoflavibacter sabulilitoris]|uniref:DUF5689 domain-containing protein n=1 Tax=Mesoflavibacter zeaxanthinifaciens subsp. sabulilitoris TaxID=1520893 RepID=A0A2T1NI49_9FLAO|nr:DUF5689 domain-containing protein [Mesoflavibacter zeaxanthinifaciens]MBB3124332.1 hypothetical protein [Mesoflavibacter zeaxanthinifaciens subsp. sabulilitoris]MCP4053383.1 DUF5017 domain-containing protein [Mesoflavibacter sp.]PSG92568.1 hypothetical protein C7H61_03750 [Mesoflavibacter zeaxanthinifaciens subsp. sabulilitoris]